MFLEGHKFIVSGEWDEGVILRSEEAGIELLVRCLQFSDDGYDDDRFCVFGVYTGHFGQRQTMAIRLRAASESGLGYIFPVNALNDSGAFDDDDRWPLVYAHAAVSHALAGRIDEIRAEHLVQEELGFSDLFNEAFSICVIGKENIKKHGIDERELTFMILRESITIPYESSSFRPLTKETMNWAPSVRVRKPECVVSADLMEQIENIIREADGRDFPLGCFLTYFQIIELLISDIFSDIISELPREQKDAWLVREKIIEITRVKKRISMLFNDCCIGIDADVAREFDEKCSFLFAAINLPDGEGGYVDRLNSVRNMVVHNQIGILRSGMLEFNDVVSSLRSLVIEATANYKKIDAAGYWNR